MFPPCLVLLVGYRAKNDWGGGNGIFGENGKTTKTNGPLEKDVTTRTMGLIGDVGPIGSNTHIGERSSEKFILCISTVLVPTFGHLVLFRAIVKIIKIICILCWADYHMHATLAKVGNWVGFWVFLDSAFANGADDARGIYAA